MLNSIVKGRIRNNHACFARGCRSWIRIEKALGLGPTRVVDIDDCRREQPIGERESWTTSQHLAARGDQHTAVVDRAARFVAEQVGVGVADLKSPRALQHKPFANLLLGERKMARARVEQNVCAALGEPSTSSI